MQWISKFNLFLFDFDGLLVNTEKLHYLAYKKMCADRGYQLPWDLPSYLRFAMFSATALREALYREFPTLDPDWNTLYQEKKQAYMHLLGHEGDLLMEGVEPLLHTLAQQNLPRCVVTHSPREQIEQIKKNNPALQTIPHWITREDYHQPKPSSECYEKAIALYGADKEHIIGFEDSPRGFQALAQTRATPVLISSFIRKNEVEDLARGPFFHFPSFSAIEL